MQEIPADFKKQTRMNLANMLDSVKRLISTRRPDEALRITRLLQGTEFESESIEALVAYKFTPDELTCPAGHTMNVDFLMTPGLICNPWVKTCPVCDEAENEQVQKEQEAGKARRKAWLIEHAEERLAEWGVPKRYRSARVSDFKGIDVKPGSLFLTGRQGTGKTHLGVACMREFLLDGGKNGLFVPVAEILLEIRDSFRRQDDVESEREILRKYSGAGFLMLDDLGVEKTTDWSLQTLYTLIDRCYREELRVVITSNLTLDELGEKLDDRIASRIAGMCRVITLAGRDKRLGRRS